jgi:DNA-binding transcriptional regulator GbsR (MarR family)
MGRGADFHRFMMLDTAIERFIGDLGVVLERDGLPRIAGRMFGYLLVSEEPQTLDALADALGSSKASISVNGRLLEERGVIERTTRMGDRRDYYQISEDIFAKTMEQRLARWRRLHAVLSEARQSLPLDSPVVSGRLDAFDKAHDNMIGVLTLALERWRSHGLSAARTSSGASQ